MENGFNRLFYRETIRNSGVGDEKVIRRSGGGHVYAHVQVTSRALSRGKGVTLAWNAGSSIPPRFASAVAQGIQDAILTGVLAGLEVTDVHASVDNGSYHEEDSNADVFREAAKKAMFEALRQSAPVILEAIASVTVAVPQELTSTIEKTILLHGGEIDSPQSDAAVPAVATNLPASGVDALITELLEATDGRANIECTIIGFQTRPDPPDTIEQWVLRT